MDTDREFSKVNYKNISPKQKEIYNFQKISAILADYGFSCIRLDDDWLGEAKTAAPGMV